MQIKQDGSGYTYDDKTSSWSDNGLGKKYWSKTYSSGHAGVHFGISLYTGLYAYLAGVSPASLSDNQEAYLTQSENEPTAIYISFDGLLDTRTAPSGVPYVQNNNPLQYHDHLSYNENYIYPPIKYSCWEILKRMDNQGRYFSLGMNGNGTANEFVFATGAGNGSYLSTSNKNARYINTVHEKYTDSLHYDMWNEVLALSDPSIFEDKNNDGLLNYTDLQTTTLWNGVQRTSDHVKVGNNSPYQSFKDVNEKYYFDYSYNYTFEDINMPVVGITLADTLTDTFVVNGDESKIKVEIIYPEGTADSDKHTNVATTINGNKVSFSVSQYIKGTELIITIPVKVNDDQDIKFNTWSDTNESANLTINVGDDKTDYAISSPKAHIEGYTITTEVIGGTITEGDMIREGRDSEISYAPNESTADSYFGLDYIEVDGKRLSAEEMEDFLNSYTFKNVRADHKIKVVYKEYFDLSGTKTWNDGGIEHNNAEDIEIGLSRTYNDGSDHTEVVNADVSWDEDTYTITRLPVYQDEAMTVKYTYKVSESVTAIAKRKLAAVNKDVEYADPVIDGFNITNNTRKKPVNPTPKTQKTYEAPKTGIDH